MVSSGEVFEDRKDEQLLTAINHTELKNESKAYAEIIEDNITIRDDYTKWRQTHYGKMKPGEFHKNALIYAKDNPYTGNAQII